MTQQDIIDHFLGNGNRWCTRVDLDREIKRGATKCLYRMSDIVQCRYSIPEGKPRKSFGPHKEYRINPEVIREIEEGRMVKT